MRRDINTSRWKKGNLKITYLENDLSVLYEKTQMIASHDFYPLFAVVNVT